MGGKDSNYQVIYRGQSLVNYRCGEWVFFQRPKECGGGYWFGRTYDDCFWLEFERPASLSEGLHYLIALQSVGARSDDFDDGEFTLTG